MGSVDSVVQLQNDMTTEDRRTFNFDGLATLHPMLRKRNEKVPAKGRRKRVSGCKGTYQKITNHRLLHPAHGFHGVLAPSGSPYRDR